MADELWSGAVTPLTFSLLADVMAEHMAHRRLSAAGFGEAAGEPVFRLYRGHVYVNASLVATVMRELPAPFVTEGLLSLLPAEMRPGLAASARSTASPAVLATVLSLTARERGWMPWARAAAFREESARLALELSRPCDLPSLDDRALAARIRFLRERMGGFLDVVSWGVIYAYVFFHLTSHLLERWAGDASGMAALLAGTEGIHTFEIHDELLAAADATRRDPALRAAVVDDPARVAAGRILDGGLGEVGSRVRSVLDRHGHRLAGRDLACPTWRERPEAVLELLRALVVAPPHDREASRAARSAETVRLLDRVGQGMGGFARRSAFAACLGWCREYYALRENMRYEADRFLALFRGAALEAGRRLAHDGVIESRDDVFFLLADELVAALEASPRPDLRARAAGRRAEHERFRDEDPPEVIRGDQEPSTSTSPAPEGHSLRGVGVSPGRSEARARVVLDVADLESVLDGGFLSARPPDPSWTSALSLAGAIVLEMGGLLSHGAIVARELGIPAVVDVAGATRMLRTGDLVTVDGTTGEISVRPA
ncbi:MAG: PEP-utilizing enzyme [Alphaproteobacteria bacterium]